MWVGGGGWWVEGAQTIAVTDFVDRVNQSKMVVIVIARESDCQKTEYKYFSFTF